ncbi:MAG: T9SS type A sorting domain-containing protein, partial [Calditrichaeota bacterium]|nr:T9SS type A sorting domain-containing protein [Calditrichota bacterium]
FDEDGDCEFWIGTNQGEIVQVNEDGTKTTIDLADIDHPNAPANLDKVNLLTKPVLGDVDGDPRLELVFGANCSDYDTYLLVFEWARADNELVFDCAIELHDQDSLNVVTYGGMPSLCDINEDGQPEISIIMFNVNFTTKNTTVHLKEYALVGNDYVWRDYPGWNVFDPSVYTTCTPAFGDIGGNPHVFYCNGPGDEPETNHFVWDIDSKIFGLELDAKVGSVVLGDIDNANSDLEVVFIDKELGLYARDAASVSPHVGAAWPANTNENTEAHGISLYKTISPFDPIANQPVLADINGDNDLEIIVSSPDSMYVYNNDGTRLANWPQPRNNLINENWCGSALVADVDDDNDLDIIMPNGHHQIEAWDGTSGDLLSYWPIVVGDRIIDYSIKDIDDDDDLELIVTTGAGYLYIYELGTGDGDVVWGQRCHDDWHTSNYEFVVPAEPANEPVYGHWYDTDHFYVIEGDCHVPDGEDWILEDGVVVYMHANVDIEIESGADMKAIGTAQNQITFTNDGQNLFNHIKFAATSGSVNSELEYCIFEGGYDGLYVTGLAPTTGALEIDNCTFSDCNYGIYINSSKVNISNSTIEDNAYNGIYLTSCSAGKVVIDGNTIQNNGTYGSIYDAGVSLSTNSDPEIINTEITGNTGGGIYCVSSAPDLDTYTSSTGTAPNTIHENGIGYGSGDQDDEDGAEIYLSLTSYPTIGSNNIWDAYYDMGYINFGAFIYKSTSLVEYDIVNAKGNYWGPVTVGESDFRWTVTAPPKTFAEMFNISSDSSELIDDVTSVEIAMGYWSDGEYEDADEYFRLAVDDEQSEAINAIHYLTGTTLKLEGDLDDLRTFYLGIVNNNEDDEVVKVAQRFATNCLSESGEYEDAAEEYDLARQNAETLNDSILAVIDYIAVSELVDSDINVAEAVIVPQKITSLLKLLDESGGSSSGSIIPDDYVLSAAFPNPFNSVTKIKFGLPEMSIVKVSVYDASGRLVKILANGVHLAGYHTTLLNGNTLSSGIYFYRIDAGSFKQTRKLILLR